MLILHSNFLKEKKLSFCLCFRVSSNDYGITEVISIQFGDITCVCIPVIPRSWTVSRARRKDNSRIHSRIRISSPNRTITRLPRRSQYRPRYYASLYTRALAFAMLFPCGYERDREKERERRWEENFLSLFGVRHPSDYRIMEQSRYMFSRYYDAFIRVYVCVLALARPIPSSSPYTDMRFVICAARRRCICRACRTH